MDMSTFKVPVLKRSGVVNVFNDEKIVGGTRTYITDTSSECALTPRHSSSQNSQPAAFEVQASAAERVGGVGLSQTETRPTLELLRGTVHTAAQQRDTGEGLQLLET